MVFVVQKETRLVRLCSAFASVNIRRDRYIEPENTTGDLLSVATLVVTLFYLQTHWTRSINLTSKASTFVDLPFSFENIFKNLDIQIRVAILTEV